MSRWEYHFEPDGDRGTRVTERWQDRRRSWMVRISPVIMGVSDREAHNRAGMEKTLAALRHAGESGEARTKPPN